MERTNNRGKRSRRKVCAFCVDKVETVDYKDVTKLRRYLSERGKIVPRRVTGTICYINERHRYFTVAFRAGSTILRESFKFDEYRNH